jgi:hypothetical protein
MSVMGMLAAGVCLASTPAAADTCQDLWYSRNEVYKTLGYCFKTTRAIRAFGNAGCLYDDIEDVPLNRAQRRMVADLQREERALGCPR